jgi:multidrug efflux pump subunit AcrA (membrane-fusion protein)
MYRHTQVGGWMLMAGGAVAALAGWVAGAPRLALGPLALVAVVWALFGTLTVTVDEDAVSCRFGPVGLIRKRSR